MRILENCMARSGRSDGTLYDALEQVLKLAKEPQTCVDLYSNPLISRIAESSNRVSDYLGNMWRDGEVLRYPAPTQPGSSARWAYAMKPKIKKQHRYGDPIEPPRPFKGEKIEVVEGTEDIVINLANYQIIFKPKK